MQVGLHARRRDVDAASPDRFAVDGVRHREGPDPVQDGGQLTGHVGAYVQHDEARRRKVIGKAAQQGGESFHPARRSADHDDIMVGMRNTVQSSCGHEKPI